MKRNILAEVEYLGTGYFGFQLQKNKQTQPTIQKEIETSLARLFRQKIKITPSGRTDRGVHARAHPFNFKIDLPIPLLNLKKALNLLLPPQIRVVKIKEVPLNFHARFQAKTKTYRYLILNTKEASVFQSNFSWHFPAKLNLKVMRQAAKKISGPKDFSFFAKNPAVYHSCVRDLKKITITKKNNLISVNLKANGFLRQMARSIVYFLTQAGAGKLKPQEIDAILAGKKKWLRSPAPPQGLYLQKVDY